MYLSRFVLLSALLLAPIIAAATPPLPPERAPDAIPKTAGVLSDSDRALYKRAFALADRKLWTTMDLAVLPISNTALVPVLEWMRLRTKDTDRSPGAFNQFLARHGDFPGLSRLRRVREARILEIADDLVVGAFLAQNPPETGEGRARMAKLLFDAGEPDLALAMAQLAWREHDLKPETEAEIVATFGQYLTAGDHWHRLDRLLWDNNRAAARRMKSLVSPGRRTLIEARLRLRNRSAGLSKAVAAVPVQYAGDQGLIYERVRYRRRSGQDEGAQDLMLDVGAIGGSGRRWWIERRIQVRNLIKAGDFQKAYLIARDHGLLSGASFAQGEFEAGWLALRFLKRPKDAVGHFQTLYDNVGYPVSRARGAYWLARAHLALGDVTTAKSWFAKAAGHPLTFYGMLAGYELGRTALDLTGQGGVDPQVQKQFNQAKLPTIIRLLHEIGRGNLARVFVTHMIKSTPDPRIYSLAAGLAADLKRHNLSVIAGKLGVLKGISLPQAAYPIDGDPGAHGRLDRAMAHAIARQESAFDQYAVSSAGARGLMQLMPATAKSVARSENVAYSRARLTSDPAYNTLLGGAYLSDQIERFSGYLPMAAAAYNAGPHRVDKWIIDYGDPRLGKLDVVDWLEMIPFSETRNYAQRVMEGLQVYRVRLSGKAKGRQTLAQDIGLKARYLCQGKQDCKP